MKATTDPQAPVEVYITTGTYGRYVTIHDALIIACFMGDACQFGNSVIDASGAARNLTPAERTRFHELLEQCSATLTS